MSRELFVTLDEGDVVSRCLAEKVAISAIERLPAGGTRLVCMSVDGAATMFRKLRPHLIQGAVTRQRHRPPLIQGTVTRQRHRPPRPLW